MTRMLRSWAAFKKELEVVKISVVGVDGVVVGDVIAVVFQRRGKERHEPDRIDAQLLKIVEFLGQATKIADTVAVGVEKRADVDLVDDCILVPEAVLSCSQALFSRWLISKLSCPSVFKKDDDKAKQSFRQKLQAK